MGGCAIGRAYMRMRMRMCMRERRERGRMDGGRGDFTCCKGVVIELLDYKISKTYTTSRNKYYVADSLL